MCDSWCVHACSSGEVTRSACVAALSLTVACAARHAIVEAECRVSVAAHKHNLQKPFDRPTHSRPIWNFLCDRVGLL